MEGLVAGTVITLEVRYPDHTGFKKRPALIISKCNNNGEFFLLEISSQPDLSPHGVRLASTDFLAASLGAESQIRTDRILTAHYSTFGRIVGTIKADLLLHVRQKVHQLLYQDN